MRTKDTHCQSLLLKASRPYHWLLAFSGTAPPPCLTFDAASTRFHCALSLIFALYGLALLSISIWMSYHNSIAAFNFVHEFKGSFTNVLSSVQSVTISFVQALNQLIVLLRFQQLVRIFDDIEQLEHDIRWNSLLQRMGAAGGTSGRQSAFRQLFHKSGCLLLFTCLFHTPTNFLLAANKMTYSHRIFTAIATVLIQMKVVEFCLMVQLISQMLQKLLDDLLFVRMQLIATDRPSDRHRLYAALQCNQQWLARAWNVVNAIESYFALPMLALFLYDVLSITNTVNWAYLTQRIPYDKTINPCTYRLCFTANILINMIVPCWLCQSCIQLYGQFASVVHNLRSNGSDVRLSMCLREYSLQLMHQKLLFSCDGYFDINLRHFGARVLTITTYVVILIQFRMQAESDIAHEAKLTENWSRNVTTN